MRTIGIFYGSTTGVTRRIAEHVRNAFGHDNADLVDVKTADVTDLDKYDDLVFGTSTWGEGEIQEDWKKFLPELEGADLAGKKVAIFGLGDQTAYDKSFVDGMGVLASAVRKAGGQLIGAWPTVGYDFSESQAVEGDFFAGLVVDEENQPELTVPRVSGWVEQLQKEFA